MAWLSYVPTGNLIQVHFNAFNINVQSPVATTTINLNTWYHLAGVKDGTTLRLYINGVQVATSTGTFTPPTYTQQPKFGTLWYNAPGNYNYGPLNGSLDELRIYNRALTPAEVLALSQTSALPVQLTSFTATKNNTGVLINWQTQYEQNSSHFNVQRSTDGINFTTIGTVQAKGNTNVMSDYQYTDNTANTLSNSKTIFYRLQQVDKDSRIQTSSILSVKYETDASNLLTLLQNPAVNEVRMQVSLAKEQQVQLQIVNAAGAAVITKQLQLSAGQNFTTLPVNTLSAGTYYITVTAGTQKQTLQFIRQ